MPIIEIHQFPASDAYITNQSAAKPVLDSVKGAEGLISLYYGLQEEDKETGYFVTVWESFQAHKEFVLGPINFGLTNKFAVLHAEGPQAQCRVRFNADTDAAFNAPITEFSFIKTRAGVSAEQRQEVIDNLLSALGTIPGIHAPAAFGETKERPGVFVLTIGWESLENHAQVAQSENAMAIIRKMDSVAETTVAHVKLTRHE
ncbi:hypothetical protein AMATHDRAFT_45122 [Amanita thiersii Skay4041]|uniref:ABM domain-containing protein n=1 Tax=Amanita thiersii Skay4041 TaxID=703135 RepID=A0A2A9NVG4_9AGAR|nr:hypothetical protein AMATHDRAFT_45122 [Amanita thiersii Skay4041]